MGIASALLAFAASGFASALVADTDDVAPTIAADRFLSHIEWLAADARNGRETGSPGYAAAAEYVAEQFDRAGLQPLAPGRSYFQEFTVLGQRELGDGNALFAGGEPLTLHEQWVPFYTAAAGVAEGAVVFAGFGIHDPDGGYDDFAHLDLDGAIVVMLRKGPRAAEEGSRYTQREQRHHMTFVNKINAAFQRGAAGVVIVNDPVGHVGEADKLMRYGPIGATAPGATIPAVHMTAEAGQALFDAHGYDLAGIQAAIDEHMAPRSFPLPSLTMRIEIDAFRPEIPTMNVVGYLPGNDPSVEGEHVVIGAHLDHVGVGTGRGARGGPSVAGQIHNGADDNASGTAGLIEIASVLAPRASELRRGVLFLAFGAEEWGLLGSAHYAEEPLLPLDDAVAMINMDMIGRSTDGYLSVEGLSTSPGFEQLVRNTHDGLGLGLDVSYGQGVPPNSDHASFARKSVPVISLFTGIHDDYHMPTDDVEHINADGGARIASLGAELVRRLATIPERPEFTEPEEAARNRPRPTAQTDRAEDAADPHTSDTAAAAGHGDGVAHGSGDASGDGDAAPASSGYRVYLGSIPDMAYQGDDGVRLSGVNPESPAKRAGLREGDRIVGLGRVEPGQEVEHRDVRNLEDYAVLLFGNPPGQRVSLLVERDGETFAVQVVLEGKDSL